MELIDIVLGTMVMQQGGGIHHGGRGMGGVGGIPSAYKTVPDNTM